MRGRVLGLLGRCDAAVSSQILRFSSAGPAWLRPGPAMCSSSSHSAPSVPVSPSTPQTRTLSVSGLVLRHSVALSSSADGRNQPNSDTPTRNSVRRATLSRSSSSSISSNGKKGAPRFYSQHQATAESQSSPDSASTTEQSPMAGATVVNPESLPWALSALRGFIPDLSSSKHKGQAGRIAVVGGCREYTGAPFFSSIAALRLGADLSHVLCSRDAAPVIKSYSPELIVHPLLKESYELQLTSPEERQQLVAKVVEEASYWVARMDCVVVGPGLGRDPFMMDCIAEIMTKAREASIPMVIDADGLFLVNKRLDLLHGYPLAILTPNVVELKRLQDSLAADANSQLATTADPDKDPMGALQEMAARLGHVTLLQKGKADTVTDGRHVIQVDAYGSPRRCGGQGDILAGSMAVLFAWAHKWSKANSASLQLKSASSRDPSSPSQVTTALSDNPGMLAATAACLAVRHAAAATFATRKRSMVTGDLIHQLGDSFEALFPVGPWESNPKL